MKQYGRKWVVLAGLVGGWVGGIVAATSSTLGVAVGGMVIQGLGLAIQPSAFSMSVVNSNISKL